MEYIDQVNEDNKIIGRTTKEESHRKGYPHRVVAVFVINKKGQLLLNRRKDNGKLDHSVGGHVRQNEDIYIAAQRECEEEIGLTPPYAFQFIDTFFVDESSRGKPIKHWFSLFVARVSHNFKPVIQSDEVVEVFWEDMDDIVEKMTALPHDYCYGFLGTMQIYLEEQKLRAQSVVIG